MLQVLPCDIPVTAGQAPRVGLMIGAIYNGRAIRLEPVSERQRRMVQVMSGDFDVVDIEGTFDKLVIMNCSSELIRCYGKISVLHLTSERFAQRLVETLGTVDVPLIAGHKERSEEWDALDMIPMRMADQDVAAQALGAARHQLWA